MDAEDKGADGEFDEPLMDTQGGGVDYKRAGEGVVFPACAGGFEEGLVAVVPGAEGPLRAGDVEGGGGAEELVENRGGEVFDSARGSRGGCGNRKRNER